MANKQNKWQIKEESIIANFHHRNKKKKIKFNANTTLNDLYHELCSRFSLRNSNNIHLTETSLIGTDINEQNFATAKEILLSSTDITASFTVTVQAKQHKKQMIHTNNDRSPSPSPLPLPYSQKVNKAAIVSQAFTDLNHNIKTSKDNNMNDGHKNGSNQMNIINAERKMKLSLMHTFNGGGNQILPIKPQRLCNFIRNNKSFLTDDESIDNETLRSIIHRVVKWWFETGLKTMALSDDSNGKNMIETEESETQSITLTLNNLGVNTINTRNYQQRLFEAAIKGNIICFMPTGSGKTRIAIKFIEYRLKLLYLNRLNNVNNDKYRKKFIIFLVCTTHLADQQKNAIKKAIPFIKIRKIIGDNNPDTWRKAEWQNELDYYDVFVMMHDCLKSALSHAYITMNNIDTLILDECHHVVGNKNNQSHPYTVIMEKYHQYKANVAELDRSIWALPRVIGLTASPIKTKELLSSKIVQKASQLQKMMDGQLMRVETEELHLVISHPTLVKYYFISLKKEESITYLDVPDIFVMRIKKYANMLNGSRDDGNMKVVVREMGVYGAAVCMRLINEKLKNKDSNDLVSSRYTSEKSEKLMERRKALELFKKYVSQNVGFFDSDLHNRYTDSKWVFDNDVSMKLGLLIKFIADSHSGIQPQIISDENDEKSEEKAEYDSELNLLFNGDSTNQQGIIFVKERIVAYVLQSILSTRFAEIKFGVLTGHSCKLWGLSDKQQCKIITQFKNGDIDYLIATSVAEEGIDIQACNCVIMYHLPETIKSYIQARGRARKRSSKYVLFISDDAEEQMRVDSFDDHEQEMIKQANSDGTLNEGNMDYNRYEYLVTETQAFASTVNAISMLQRYFDYLGIGKTEIEKICFPNGDDTFTFILFIYCDKWKLKKVEFTNNGSSKREAEKRCAVDIIGALRDGGLWDMNLVPVEIVTKNKETQLMQKQRALFQSTNIEKVHIPSVMSQDFESEVKDDLDIDMDMTANDKIGYLYHIAIENDPNQFPMGIILPKRIPDQFLKSIQFSAQIRERNEAKTSKDIRDYADTLHEQLHELENKMEIENKEEEKAHQLLPETDGKDCGDKPDLSSQKMGKSRYTKTNVSLRVTKINNIICVSSDRFNHLKLYHSIVFKLLDRGGTKNKIHLSEITEQKFELKSELCPENERFYLICPLRLTESGDRLIIDWKCIDDIVNLHFNYELNQPNGVTMPNLENQVIQTRNEDKTHQNMYISYGIHELFSSQSQVPISGQIIADYVSYDARMHQILHSNLKLDKNDDRTESNAAPLDEIDLSAQNTQLNQLKTVSIAENYQTLMLSTKYPGQNNNENEEDDRVVIARRYSPKIRNTLVRSRKKSKSSKSKLKSSVMFIPLQHVFPTGISTSHWYQLLNIPSLVWRLENYFNLFDAQKLLQSLCEVSIDPHLLFESLCNAQAGTDKTYEKLECLGDRVLKFLVAVQGIFMMPSADPGQLTIWESNIVSNSNLYDSSLSINLPSYGVFCAYAFELWNPSFFKQRTNKASQSLYKNVKISLKLPADIIESTIGALWHTLIDDVLSDNQVTMAMNSCRVLLRNYKLLKKDFAIDDKFMQLISAWNENKFVFFSKSIFQSNLKQIIEIIEEDCGYRLNVQYPLVTASLIELIDKHYHHHHHAVFADYGITYQRLEFLGDAILDIIVTHFLYNDETIFDSDLSIEGQITSLRGKIVGNDVLGFNLQESSLDECIEWELQQQIDIDQYKEDIEKLDRDENNDFWHLNGIRELNIQCPKCLGDAFEVLLAIIFIDSNYNNLFVENNIDGMSLKYSLKACVQFVCGFHDYAEKHWQDKLV